MGQIADALACRKAISRGDQDASALESHRSAARAIAEGLFEAEILPVTGDRDKTPDVVDTDEGPRADADRLASLRPAFGAGSR
jgi:acetyl-CoA C-acetyltransferase